MTNQLIQLIPAPGWSAIFRAERPPRTPGDKPEPVIAVKPLAGWVLLETTNNRGELVKRIEGLIAFSDAQGSGIYPISDFVDFAGYAGPGESGYAESATGPTEINRVDPLAANWGKA